MIQQQGFGYSLIRRSGGGLPPPPRRHFEFFQLTPSEKEVFLVMWWKEETKGMSAQTNNHNMNVWTSGWISLPNISIYICCHLSVPYSPLCSVVFKHSPHFPLGVGVRVIKGGGSFVLNLALPLVIMTLLYYFLNVKFLALMSWKF